MKAETLRHTQSKWTAHIASSGGRTFGFRVTAEGRNPPVCHLGTYEREVATVAEDFRKIAPEYFTPEELEANARLIAAAPELLEACEEMLRTLVSPSRELLHSTRKELEPWLPMLRADIAKATGDQPC